MYWDEENSPRYQARPGIEVLLLLFPLQGLHQPMSILIPALLGIWRVLPLPRRLNLLPPLPTWILLLARRDTPVHHLRAHPRHPSRRFFQL